MSDHETQYSLLERALNTQDQDAWTDLLGNYRSFIYHVLKTLNVASQDTDDIAQEVMVTLSHKLQKYEKNKGKFRSWLGKVVKNSVAMHYRKKNTLKSAPNQNTTDDFSQVERMSSNDLERIVEEEWQRFVTRKAMDIVEQSYKGNAIKAFQLSLEGKTTDEIAAEIEVLPSSVYTLVSRVKQSMIVAVHEVIRDYEL